MRSTILNETSDREKQACSKSNFDVFEKRKIPKSSLGLTECKTL